MTDWSQVQPEVVVGLIVLFGAAAAVVVGFGWMLFRAGQLNHPSPLIVSLTMLTGLALIGALISHDTDAYNLAAVGIGALAGSLAVVYRNSDPPKREKPPAPPDTGDGGAGESDASGTGG